MADEFDGSMDAAASAFSALAPMDDQPLRRDDVPEEQEEGGTPVDSGDEADQDAGAEDEGDEPDEAADEQDEEPAPPAIDPPVSWDAEAKKVFAKLPPEAQRIVADRESQRDRAIQEKATEAATHRKAAEALTENYAQLHRQYAEQLETYAQAYEPQRPDYGLLATDPAAFAQQMAQYEATAAQRNYLAQQAEQSRRQAQQIEEARTAAETRAELARLAEVIPEWNDPAKRGPLIADFEKTGRALGYDDDLMAQARAVDIIGLKTATEWRSKAEKYDALQARKMDAVRSAKTLPKVSTPGTAQPKGSARAQGLQDSMSRLRQTGSVDDAAAAFRNLGRR